MENYIETAVSRKNNIKDTLTSFILCVPPMLLGTYIVILMYATGNSVFLVLGLLVAALLYYAAYKIFLKFNIEWEYTLVGNEIRFSKIINKTKRRDLITVNLSKTEIVAKVNDTSNNHSLRSFGGRKFSFISQTTNEYYYMLTFTDKGERVAVMFEPSDRMKENFRTTLRGKFFE